MWKVARTILMRDISKMLVSTSTFRQKHSSSTNIAKNLTGEAQRTRLCIVATGLAGMTSPDFNFRKNSQNFYFSNIFKKKKIFTKNIHLLPNYETLMTTRLKSIKLRCVVSSRTAYAITEDVMRVTGKWRILSKFLNYQRTKISHLHMFTNTGRTRTYCNFGTLFGI